ncbi:MAG: FAD:protein FMN transferase [Bacteroidetes bacterium]|nr:FAD:protein FMN transferase [Bacteroidota bacterium]
MTTTSIAKSQSSSRLIFAKPLMGTEAHIVLYAADSLKATRAVESAFSRIDDLNNHLSDYLVESELSRLSNTHGQPVSVTQDLWDVLTASQEVARLSKGKFDVTSGPLTFLWRHAMRRGMLPDSIALRKAISVVGFELLHMNPDTMTVELEKKNMRLDLGGIAKGYAADQALAVLFQEGFYSVAVNLGGDIALGNAPPDTDGWSIKVFHGESGTENMILANCGIAVSGDTYKYLEYQGMRYSHIVDPQSGYGITHKRKVAVIASSAMMADAWASAYSVMDWQEVVTSAQNQHNFSIRIVESGMEDLKQLNTGRFELNK